MTEYEKLVLERAAESLKNPPPRYNPPQLSHKFRVLPLNIGNEYTEHFAQQVQDAKFDMSAKTLTLTVMQTQHLETFDMISKFLTECKTVVVDFLETPHVNFSAVVPIQDVKHELALTYADGNALMHKIIISYDQLCSIKGDRPVSNNKVQMFSTGTDEFLTPQAALEAIKKVDAEAPKEVKKKNVKQQADKN